MGDETRGLFIVFEGIDGSGKTTQITRLANYIRAQNKYQDILLTREPTWRANELRRKLQDDANAFSDGEQMARLFIENRKKHYVEQIKPALEQRTIVLCDRYAMSTCAYQTAQSVPIDTLLELHEDAGTGTPDMTLYVDVLREVAVERMLRRGAAPEKFEKDKDFSDLLVLKYQLLVDQELLDVRIRNVIGPVTKIYGVKIVDDVEVEIKQAFDRYVSQH